VTLRDALLVGQIAICAVLVTASIVAVRGLVRSLHAGYGFEPQRALLVDTDLSMANYTGEQLPVMQRRMIDALRQLPGVGAVSMASTVPLSASGSTSLIFADTTTELRPANAAATATRYSVGPAYFEAAGTSLLIGRSFSWHDDPHAPRVAVVNRQFAKKIYGSVERALGAHFKLRDGTRIEVAGVVEDGKYANLAEDPRVALFVPMLQMQTTETWLIVRCATEPQSIAAAVRSKLRELDRGLPFNVRTWTQELDLALFPPRMATMALGVMGGMGAVLAITGIFGMAAYSVSSRRKEIGIRIAVGAKRREVLGTALGRAFALLTFGSVAGIVLGVLASRVLGSIVYQATPRDPVVLAGVVGVMFLIGLVATWIPAQRALALDPLKLLREE
jgi:predicted permease